MNSIKHNLSSASRNFVLQSEDDAQWQNLLQICIAQWKPATEVEMELVVEIAFARWRMRRLWSVETAIIDTEMDRQAPQLARQFSHIDGAVRTGSAFSSLTTSGGGLTLMPRYETRVRRSFERAVADLERLQKQRAQNEPGNTPSEPRT